MKHIEKIVIGMIAVLFVVIVIIATDFWLLWLPLEHSSEYPQKIAALFMAVTAFVTLLVVYTTFNATKQSNLREETRSKDEIEKENRARKERLLNEIIEWATNIVEIPAQMNFVVWQEIINMREPKRSVYIENMTRQNVMELRRRYTILTGRRMRIKILSAVFKKYKLDIIANCVIDSLNDVISVLDKRSEGKISDDEVNNARVILDKRVDALVTKASNIDTRYTG